MIKTFFDLNAWKKGHELVLLVYEEVIKFPGYEKFGLADQMRRSSVSITSNIAEGFSRRFGKEKKQLYSIALGSVTELQNQMVIAKDVGYLSPEVFDDLFEKSVVVYKLVKGLMKSSPDLHT